MLPKTVVTVLQCFGSELFRMSLSNTLVTASSLLALFILYFYLLHSRLIYALAGADSSRYMKQERDGLCQAEQWLCHPNFCSLPQPQQ